MSREIGDLELVRHTCLVPESDEHIWEATSAWIASGLRAGERVLYFEDGTADRLLERLDDDRVPVRRAIDEGQFSLVPTEMTRGTVTVPLDQVEELMLTSITETAEQGWPGMRFIGESANARMDLGQGLDELVGYETAVERVLARHPHVRLLCIYDRRVFDDVAVAEMRRIHRTELVAGAMYDDGLLRITRTAPGTLRLAGEIDHSNRMVLRHVLDRTFETMLRSATDPNDIVLDLASLRFLDVATSTELVHYAGRFPAGHRLVLEGVRSRVRRVFAHCNRPAAPALVLPPRGVSWSGGARP